MSGQKSEYIRRIESIIHGKPSKVNARDSQMFDILCWNQSDGKEIQTVLKEDQDLTESKSIFISREDNVQQSNEKDKRREKKIEQEERQRTEQQNLLGVIKKGHEIKNELYMYEEVKLKKSLSSEQPTPREKKKARSPIRKEYQSVTKLNPDNQKDKKIIEDRKARIKEFNLLSRNLPNSAFTTYFGKPAFEAYGRGSSHYQKKSHNVMPHRGENHPHNAQSYDGALLKGKTIYHQNYVPRKPLNEGKISTRTEFPQEKDVIHLPLEKPDLINHVRFAEPESSQGGKKQGIPTATKTKTSTKKVEKKPKVGKKKRKQKKNAFLNDGLKYMNIRSNLIQLLEQKKKKDSQLAYKVTECYPSHWQCNTKSSVYGKTVAAGKKFQKGERAEDVISQWK